MPTKRSKECIHGHDLTDPKNVRIIRRKFKNAKTGKVYGPYEVRDCRICHNDRIRERVRNGTRSA